MRILLVTRELGYRGTPKVVAEYARLLSSCNEVAIWAFGIGGETAEQLQSEGFQVWIGGNCDAELQEFQPQVVNIHRSGVYDAYETKILERFHRMGAKGIETSTFGRVDRSVAGYLSLSIQISRWDLFQWRAWGGGAVAVGAYCPNPVNTDVFRRASVSEIASTRTSWGIPCDGEPSAFVIGRIGNTSWKSFAPLVKKVLHERENVFLVHVRDHSNAIPTELMTHPRVKCINRLVGPHALSKFYSACDLCVSMSEIGESFGLVNAEAIACETPVVALSAPFHCNAVLEVVAASKGGMVASRAEGLFKLIDSAVRNRVGLRQNVLLARQNIVSKYSRQSVKDRLLRIFDAVQKGTQEQVEDVVTAEEFAGLMRLTSERYSRLTQLLIFCYYTPLVYRVAGLFKFLKRIVRRLRF